MESCGFGLKRQHPGSLQFAPRVVQLAAGMSIIEVAVAHHGLAAAEPPL
jgi:hypothetical protein